MNITDFPNYVLNDSWSKQDLDRAKNNIAKLENLLSQIKTSELKMELNYTKEEFELFCQLYKKIDADTLSLARLFNRYLSIARTSDNSTMKKIALIFNEDFNILPSLITEISENQINNIVYLEYLKKLLKPYSTVILTFIFIVNTQIAKRENHFSSSMSETKDFDEILKELENV